MSDAVTAQGSFGLSCWSGDPAAMGLPHIHDDIEINVSGGALGYIIGGERVTVPARSLLLFWAAQPHQLVEAEERRPTHWVTIPLRMLLEWRLPPAFLGSLFAGDVFLLDAAEAGIDDRRLAHWERELAGDPFAQETARLDLAVHLRRMARGAGEGGAAGAVPSAERAEAASARVAAATAGSEPERRIELVTRMADYVTAHALEGVSVADVARAVSLHPTYAMTLFKRVLGVTIGDYATTCRIQEAQRRLITTQDSVAAIAHGVGYSSLSQFHAKFRSVVGVSPGAYRRGRTGE